MVWQSQALSVLKRALKYPGVLQEAVLDISPTREVRIEVVAHEHAKLIIPEDDGE